MNTTCIFGLTPHANVAKNVLIMNLLRRFIVVYEFDIITRMDISSDVKSIDSSDYDMWNENDVAGNMTSSNTNTVNKSGKVFSLQYAFFSINLSYYNLKCTYR